MKSIRVSAPNSTARKTYNTVLRKLPVPTASIVGPLSATRRKTAPSPQNTFRAIWSAMTILMTTATGAMSRNTATFGIRAKLLLAGPLTAMAIGTGSARGAGRGLIIHHGASRRTTMGAGTISEAGGAGAQAQFMGLRC